VNFLVVNLDFIERVLARKYLHAHNDTLIYGSRLVRLRTHVLQCISRPGGIDCDVSLYFPRKLLTTANLQKIEDKSF
jgi:hypothetical protein